MANNHGYVFNKLQTWNEGKQAENLFASIRKDNIIRKSTLQEDRTEHWDFLDKELGRVDVKAAKRLHRHGPVDHTIWWELRTVKKPPDMKPKRGWGVPNGIERLIAVQSESAFHLIRPESIIEDLRKRCTKYFRGEFGLHTRPDREDLITILPMWYVEEHAEKEIPIC